MSVMSAARRRLNGQTTAFQRGNSGVNSSLAMVAGPSLLVPSSSSSPAAAAADRPHQFLASSFLSSTSMSDTVDDGGDYFLESSGGNDGNANSTLANCSNSYCVSDEEYIDMIRDYIQPNTFEWYAIAASDYMFKPNKFISVVFVHLKGN